MGSFVFLIFHCVISRGQSDATELTRQEREEDATHARRNERLSDADPIVCFVSEETTESNGGRQASEVDKEEWGKAL